MLRICLFATAAMMIAGSAASQELKTDQRVIVVIGRGEAEQKAEFATITFDYRGEGKSETDALAAMTARRAKIEEALLGLEGVKSADVNSSNLSVSAVRGEDCDAEKYEEKGLLDAGKCSIVGHIATMKGSAKIAPAEVIGNAASIAAQFGAYDVRVSDGGLIDATSLDNAALADAFKDAQRQAQVAAAAANLRLGPVVRIQDSSLRYGDTEVEELV
ncbi:MAG: SIMPL domain-containing protein [Caulobacteraceae bacterium]